MTAQCWKNYHSVEFKDDCELTYFLKEQLPDIVLILKEKETRMSTGLSNILSPGGTWEGF